MAAVEFEFPAAVSTKLREFAKQFQFFASIGRPGRGKVTAILKTFEHAAEVPEIGRHVVDDNEDGKIDLNGAVEICKGLQSDLRGRRLWIIRQADLLTKEAVEYITSHTASQVILVGLKFVNIDKDRWLYMPDHNKKGLVRTMMDLGHSAERADTVVKACGTDLHQINIVLGFGTVCGVKSHTNHRLNDTQQIMAGHELPAEAYHPNWIAANLHGDFEDMAKAHETLAFTNNLFPDKLSLNPSILKHEVQMMVGKSKWYGRATRPKRLDLLGKPQRPDRRNDLSQFEIPAEYFARVEEEPVEPPARRPRLEELVEPEAVDVLPELADELMPALAEEEPVEVLPEPPEEQEPEWTTCHAGTLCRSNVPVVQTCANPEPMDAFLGEYAEPKSKKVRALCALYRADLTSVAENGFSLRDDDFFSTVEIDSMPWVLIMKDGNDQRCFSPVGKLYTIAFPTRGGMTAMKQFRAKVVKAFLKLGTTRGNVGLPDESASVDARALDEHYMDLSNEDFILAVADARLKKARGNDLDRFEQALLVNQVQPLIMQHRKNREDLAKAKSACVYHIENDPKLVEFRRDRDFTPAADNLVYQRFNPETGVLDEITDVQLDRGTSWKVYAQMLNGDPSIGKTPLHIAKAISYCIRKGKQYFIRVKGSIEPLVHLSRANVLTDAGAIILEDFQLFTDRNPLTNEELKALFDVRDGGEIESKRWGHISFPPHLPRLFSFNESGRSLLNVFGDPSNHQRAQLKRVCIAGYRELVTTKLIKSSTVQDLSHSLEGDNEIEIQRERDYWLSRDGRASRE